MVMAPQAYMEPIITLIGELDSPGLQVLVHGVIAEITHDNVTTLGVRFASDPALLSDSRLTDQAISGGVTATANNVYSGFFGLGSDGKTTITTNVGVNVLVQLLMEKYRMKVLFEPKVYTADNMEAEFVDGQEVPFQTTAQTSAELTSTVRSFDYKSVGTLLRVRPHITQEGGVDLKVNLELSGIAPGQSVFGNFIFDRRETTTHVILRDGQTVMISGITRQEDFDDVRKLPLLGDIPLLGLLFRSVDKAKRNRELVAFITPHVIRSAEESDEKMKPYRDSLDRLKGQMGPLQLDEGKSPATRTGAKGPRDKPQEGPEQQGASP